MFPPAESSYIVWPITGRRADAIQLSGGIVKLLTTLTILIATSLLLNACANTTVINAAKIANENASKSGSPYRWETQQVSGGTALTRTLIGAPGITSADEVVERDVIAAIEKSSEDVSHKLTQPKEVRIVAKTTVNSTEVWVFDGPDKDFVYVVKLQTSGSGGTDIEITGPW
jgi:hypothetical protein